MTSSRATATSSKQLMPVHRSRPLDIDDDGDVDRNARRRQATGRSVRDRSRATLVVRSVAGRRQGRREPLQPSAMALAPLGPRRHRQRAAPPPSPCGDIVEAHHAQDCRGHCTGSANYAWRRAKVIGRDSAIGPNAFAFKSKQIPRAVPTGSMGMFNVSPARS